ncbi:MAG TPA: pyrrolo-quinoline quinone, partial [Rhodospirillaceae bacterium]|nr:pyrrolo-quinoline quinone [Rhodospirillaceae bacterium]
MLGLTEKFLIVLRSKCLRAKLNIVPVVLTAFVLCACDSPDNTELSNVFSDLAENAPPPSHEWHHFLGDAASRQYSPLDQITSDNVHTLHEAWRYDPGFATAHDTEIPTNPLIIKGVLYGLNARKDLFALNAATGEELWVHTVEHARAGKRTGRGLVYWEGVDDSGQVARWIILGLGHELIAVNAETGERVESFGIKGAVDLREGLDRPIEGVGVNVSSPGTLYGDLLIQGFGTGEFYGAAPGYIRAYHLPSGALTWTFRTIPGAGEYGADTWPDTNREAFGGANSWAGITVDTERGIAYVPTGSAAYDFYGADREGDNLFASSLVALDANTGERLWHHQMVRHDLWDRDLASPPNLIEIERDGEIIAAVAQSTKSGHLFVFDRESGKPLFPLVETPVTGAGVPGEHLPQSQLLPQLPPPFTQQVFSVTDILSDSTAYVEDQIRGMTTDKPFHAPDEDGIVLYPGLDGGAEWGGQAWDASSGLLFVNANEVPWHYTMQGLTADDPGMMSMEGSYQMFCGVCHGADRRGKGEVFPSLRDIGDKYWPWEVWQIIREGRGRMPSFGSQPWNYLWRPLVYIYTAGDSEGRKGVDPSNITHYGADGYNRLQDEFRLPGSKPPWGSLSAINVKEGRIAWKIPLGDFPKALELGFEGLGA